MLKIAVCDDENIYLEKIKKQILQGLTSNHIKEFEIRTFDSGFELCKSDAQLNEYQVYFLDINMAEINGLELAQKIRRKNRNALLVFVTAYIDYAMEGYKVDAVRFIVKDLLEEMMPECMEAVCEAHFCSLDAA